jgi:hypothetical protein
MNATRASAARVEPHLGPDFADAASAAIETWAARRRPEARNLLWVGKTPALDWGFETSAWLREISEIQREFERLIGFPVPLPPIEKRKTAGFSLLKTHYVLVRKAETKSGRTMLKALLG